MPNPRATRAAAVGVCALALLLVGCKKDQGPLQTALPAATSTLSACSPPGTNPKFIAIVGQGITSSVETNTTGATSFNPAAVSYCTSPDGQSPPDNPQVMLQSMANKWLDWHCRSSGTSFGECTADSYTIHYPNDLIDALAQAGGYVLPFSYLGARMSREQDHPLFSLTPYSSDDVATSNPTMYPIRPDGTFTDSNSGLARQEPTVLNDEITSIHQVFPHTPILVIAHSNGGLIAEQWWQHYGFRNREGVVQVFSLDSPLNGVATGVFIAQNGLAGPVQRVVGAAYTKLWHQKEQNDAYALLLDRQTSLFTPIGSYGDPLYDLVDFTAGIKHWDTNQPGPGVISQLFFNGDCWGTGDVTNDACQPTGPDFVSTCAQHWYTGLDYAPDYTPVDYVPMKYTWPEYGFTGKSNWQHSVVKNCRGVIDEIMSYVPSSSPATPSPNPSPTPQCTAFSSACPDRPNNGGPYAATPSASVTPGYAAPQAAVAGFYRGELTGDWDAVCSYVVPSAQSICLAGTSGQSAATGSISVERAVIQGIEALVGVTGNICAPSTPCAANTDPSLGMPTSGSDFAALYRAAVASGSNGGGAYMSPMPCTQVGGKWYVAFG